jgi:hypothetical protein
MGANRAGTNYRLGRLAGGLTGTMAAAVAILMIVSPMSSGASASVLFPHATTNINWSVYQAGCGKGAVQKPGISLATGIGHASVKGHAATCGLAKGGNTVPSEGEGATGMGITEVATLTASASQVNITFNIQALATDMATGKVPKVCPGNTYTGTYTSGNTSVTYTDSYTQCEAQANWEVYLEPYVQDTTNGGFSSGFQYMYNSSGNYFETYADYTNYSNPYYTNSSYVGTYNQSYGAGPYSTRLSWTPSVLISPPASGWNSGDHLVIYAQIYIYASTYIIGENHAKGSASFLASGSAGHVDISGITIT